MDETTSSQSLVNGLELPGSPGDTGFRERVELLEQVGERVAAVRPLDPASRETLLPWLVETAGRFRKKPAVNNQQRIVSLALEIASRIPETGDPAMAADLAMDLLTGQQTGNLNVEPDVVVDVLAGREDAARIITAILIRGPRAGEDPRTFLATWQRLLLPLLGDDPGVLAGPDCPAARMLEQLGTLEESVIPGELALMLGRLAIIAGPGRVEPLRETGAGRLIDRLYPGILTRNPAMGEASTAPDTSAAPTATAPIPPVPAGPHDRFLATIDRELREYLDGMDAGIRQLRETVAKVNNDAHELTAERDRLNIDMERERGNHREREARSRDQASQLRQEMDDLRGQMEALREERDRWEQETRLTEQGSASSLELRVNEYRDRIRDNLTRPLREVQGTVERMLEQEPTRKQIRLVAANLDKLVAQMIRIGVLGEGEVRRIPREQFMQSGS